MRVAHAPVALRTPEPPVYVLYESSPLPSIDCTTCIKDVLLSPRWLARCNFGLHKLRRVISLAYALSLIPALVTSYVPAPIGRIMGLLVLGLQVGPLLAISLVLRYDMVRVLAGTYEFWYLTLINAVTNALAIAKYGDTRGFVALLAFVGYENALLVDATNRGPQNMVVLSVVSGAVLSGYTVYAAFDLVDRTQSVVLFAHGNWLVEGGDLIVNGMITIILTLLRNAYRKQRQIGPSVSGDATVVRCITYRCRVRLVEQTLPPETLVQSFRYSTTTNPLELTSTRSPLRLVYPGQVFKSGDVVCRIFWEQDPLRTQRSKIVYRLISWAAAATSAVSFVRPGFTVLTTVAVLLSAVLVAFTLGLCQRRLLRKLLSSFDVAFISVQFTLMLLSLSYLQDWDYRSVTMLNCWLWIHWVLLLDTVTPAAKSAVGVQHGLAVVVVSLFILGQILIAVDLVFLQRWQLKDRTIFILHIGPHSLHWRTAPFMLSRIFTLFWWCCRLLWRLVTRSENELILIQEAVEFDDTRRSWEQRRKALGATTTANAVVPS